MLWGVLSFGKHYVAVTHNQKNRWLAVPIGAEFGLLTNGRGSKSNRWGYADVGPCFP